LFLNEAGSLFFIIDILMIFSVHRRPHRYSSSH